jgi:putative transposase
MKAAERRAMVDHNDPVLPIVAQCRLLKIVRSTLYYRPVLVDPDDPAVMRRMDELYLASPFYGSRRMVAVLRRDRSPRPCPGRSRPLDAEPARADA